MSNNNVSKTFFLLSEESQVLVALSSMMIDKLSRKELDSIGQLTQNKWLINLIENIDNKTLAECEASGFLRYRYAAIESNSFNNEDLFFEVMNLPFFRTLCLGYCKYLLASSNRFWTWTLNGQMRYLAFRMMFYVFSETEIDADKNLKSFIRRFEMSEDALNNNTLRQALFLYNLTIEEINRIIDPKLRMLLVESVANSHFASGVCVQGIITYLIDRLHQIKNYQTVQGLCQQLLFRADVEQLKIIIRDAPIDYYKAWAEGHLFFLEGDFKKAYVYLEAGQDLFKKANKVRRVDYDTIQLLIGLCMLKLGVVESEWDKYWKGIVTKGLSASLPVKLTMMLANMANTKELQEIQQGEVLSLSQQTYIHHAPFVAYMCYWVSRKDVAYKMLQDKNVHQMVQSNLWLFDEINNLYRLMEEEDPQLPENAVLHQIYAPKPEWELLLDQIQKIMLVSNPDIVEGQEERVVWLVDFKKFSIEPRLQKLNKNGTWSKGRSMAWNKIMEAEYNHVTSSYDKKIITAYEKIFNIQKELYYAEVAPKYWMPVFDALVGHPFLYLSESMATPCQLLRGKLELQITKTEKGYIFENPYKDFTIDNIFVLKKETPTRYIFIELNAEQRQILDILGKKSLNIPEKGIEELRKTAQQLSNIVPIHSDLIVDENLPEHPYDTRIYVHILPVGDMFQVELYVKPFGVVAPYSGPGNGLERLVAEVEGVKMFVQRDLEQEKTNAEMIVAYSKILDMDEDESGIWTIDGIEPCLQLLAELNDLRREEKIVLEWPQGEKLKISAYANFDQLFMNVRSSGDWFEMEGELKVDDTKILDMKTLLELSRNAKGRFLTLDDGSYMALTEQLQKRLQALDNMAYSKKDQLLFSKFSGAAFGDLASDMHLEGDEGWTDFVLRMEEAKEKNFKLPKGLNAELRPYQKEGYNWLCRMAWWGAGACLADDMGLGKTVQAIALILRRSTEGPTLVVAPASVCSNWISELERFAPDLKAYNLSDVEDRTLTIEGMKAREILVCTYGLMHQNSEILTNIKFATIVLDEAQSIKNRMTKRSQAAMELQGDFKLITTGTPIENHLGELWNLFHFINPGLLGTAAQFQERYALPIEKWGDKDRRSQLQGLIKPFVLRRLKKDVLKDLPEKTEITLRVERGDVEEAFYEALRQKALEKIYAGKFENEGQKQLQILAELMRLRRACCTPGLIPGGTNVPSAKLEALSDLIDELLENNHKALIFSQFVDYLRIIEKMVQEKGVAYKYLDGSTPLKKRKIAVDEFQDGEGDLFLISLKAGGTGLNLTAADYVIHVDPWWNPAVEDQASDRAHRIGQQNPVTVYRLVATNSIEEKIVRLHEYKREMAEALLQETDGKTRMNATDLLELIKGEM